MIIFNKLTWKIFTLILFNYLAKSDNRKVPNMDVLRKHLLREGHLNKPELTEIISEATNILSKYIYFLRYLYYFSM